MRFTTITKMRKVARVAAAEYRRQFTAGNVTGFDIAGGSGRWPGPYQLHAPTSQALAALRVSSRKLRWLDANSALVASIISNAVSAIVADGPTCQPTHPDAEINADLRARWNAFTDECDAEGAHSLAGLLTSIARALYLDGEAFVQLVVDPVTLRLQLRLLTAEQVDATITRPALGEPAPYDVSGIRFDANGRKSGIWVLPQPPDSPSASVAPAKLIDALDVCHVFEPRSPGAPRGISPLTAIAGLALELDVAHDAAITKLKTECLVGLVLRDLDGFDSDIDNSTDPASLQLEPGATLRLPPGTDAVFPPVSQMSTVAGVLTHMSRLICAGAGVPHFMATSDYGSINYSAGKLGLASFQRRVKAIQQNNIVAQLLRPIWNRFVLLEVLSGRMRAPDYESAPQNYAARWLFPGWPALDELKKAKADTLAVNARLRSRAEIISDSGRDPADVDREIESDPMTPDLAASADSVLNQVDLEGQQNG